jgi:hypothetical protein
MKKITPAQWRSFLLILFVLFGGWLRFAPTVLAGDVINDGGMFYSMAQDLHENRYIIPKLVTYNDLNVPFAYPPLPFYMTAFLSDFGIPLIEIFRWIPALVSTISILAFYLLAKAMLKSSATAALATAAFAFLPRAYTWFVMGGGVSRALGQFFMLLTVWSAYQLFSQKQIKYILLTTFFGALVTLSHPSQWLHTVVICVFLWLILDWTAFSHALSVAFGVVLLTAPWWLTVVLRHGFAPFLNASRTGGLSALSWLPLVIPTFAEEQFLTIFTILGLVGIAIQLIRKQYLLPLFLIIPFIIDPRSAPSIAVLPLAMLAGIGLNDLILPGLVAHVPLAEEVDESSRGADWPDLFAAHRPIRWVLSYFLFIALLGAYAYDQPLAHIVVPESSKEALEWIYANTPPESAFLLITGINDPFADPLQEWFPVLAKRVSVTTVQGREWLLGKDFLEYLYTLSDLQNCMNVDPNCVEKWAIAQNTSYDYLYLLKAQSSLTFLLQNSPYYELVYETMDVVIFARVSGDR